MRRGLRAFTFFVCILLILLLFIVIGQPPSQWTEEEKAGYYSYLQARQAANVITGNRPELVGYLTWGVILAMLASTVFWLNTQLFKVKNPWNVMLVGYITSILTGAFVSYMMGLFILDISPKVSQGKLLLGMGLAGLGGWGLAIGLYNLVYSRLGVISPVKDKNS